VKINFIIKNRIYDCFKTYLNQNKLDFYKKLMNSNRILNLKLICFNKVYKKNIFNFMKKNILNNKTKDIKYSENEKKETINVRSTEKSEKSLDNINQDQPKENITTKRTPIKESKINKYFRDDIKKYDGRLN
jgi:hypothetical protein